MKKVLLTCAAAGLLVGSSVASAAAIAPAPMFHPWYIGVGLKWNANLTDKWDTVAVDTGVSLKNKLGWDIFGGYMVSPKFGTELGFVDYGKATRTTKAAGINTGKWDANGWLVYFDGMYYVPLCKYFKVFAKGGVDYINHSEKSYQWNAATSSWVRTAAVAVDSKLNVVSGNLGAGIQFDYNQFGARFTYTNYNEFIHENTLAVAWVPNLLNLDVLYHFG
ncbi:MAG: outer membrane beta-barrel protein [Gammaproteobacteria bacterium]|jgi:hypothetical protein